MPPAAIQTRDPEQTHRLVSRLRRRSLLIGFWRGALPAVMGLSVLGLGVWAGIKTFGDLQPTTRSAGEIRMVSPQFHGHDKNGRPYVVTADSAVRDPVHQTRSILTQPKLVMQTEKRGEVTVMAPAGVYDEAAKLMDLSGGVVASDALGYRFTSPTAHVNNEAHTVTGNQGVVATGPLGQTTGSAYAIDDKAGHALLTGGVKTHLVPHAAKP